jgi:hypothetical protein
MEALAQMLDMSQALQQVGRDGDPTTMTSDRHRISYIRDQFEGMLHEMVEAKDECGWKPWGTAEHINPEAMARELIDAWHFFNNWLLTLRPLLGFDNNEDFVAWLTEAYAAKHIVNMERFTSNNYDGFKEKCKACGREREAATWEEEELSIRGEGSVLIERYLVCPCGAVYEHKALDERGSDVG